MKILLVQGSPHKKGSSNMLAEQFMEGAKAAGHTVSVFDAAHANLDAKIADTKENPLMFGTELIINSIYRHVIIDGEPLKLT